MREVCTIGIFAHANAGKTTLTEHILFHSGVISDIGRVDYGNTITDKMEVERQRGISVRATYVTFELGEKSIQLVDTPGHVDFSAEVIRAVNILDAAILVLSGVEGIEAQTSVIWKLLKKRKIPTIFFINKLDRKGANKVACIDEIRKLLASNVVLENDIIEMDGKYAVEVVSSFNKLEDISDIDDEALKYYFSCIDGSKLIDDNIINSLCANLFNNGLLHPICLGSALNDIGISQLLYILQNYLPAKQINVSDDSKFTGYIYSIQHSDNIREVYIKILQGKLTTRTIITIGDNMQKIKELFIIKGNKKVLVEELYAGQIGIAIGIVGITQGMLLGDQEYRYNSLDIDLMPLFTSKIIAIGSVSQIQLLGALRNINEEDSLLNVRYDKQSKQIQIDLMGELQGETIIAILKEKYNIEAEVSSPSIIYKETPSEIAFGKASYTRVSNVMFKIIPKERGSGFVYKSLLDTDFLFSSYQKQVARLVVQYIKFGFFGWELTDVEVQLVGGKCDRVGSEPFHYNIAVPIALARAIRESKTILLEPMVEFTLTFPNEQGQQIFSSVVAMSLTNNTKELGDGYRQINGTALLSKVIRFAQQIKKITSGKGVLEYIPFGFVEKAGAEIVYNHFVECDIYSEEIFLSLMHASIKNLDTGLDARSGRPERIKRNRHLWKKDSKGRPIRPDY